MIPLTAQDARRTEAPRTAAPEPCSLIIFGGAGDLARRKLLPALWNLHLDGALPRAFAVIGFARTEIDDEGYRAFAKESIQHHSRRPLDDAAWETFRASIFWVRGAFDDASAYASLKRSLDAIEPKLGIPGNRIFYLSVPPSVMM